MPFPREEESESDKIHGDKLEDLVKLASEPKREQQARNEDADEVEDEPPDADDLESDDEELDAEIDEEDED